jgi:hypothetical protein
LQRHPNGVLGISEILLSAQQPQVHSHILAEVTGVAPQTAEDRSIEVVAGKARLAVRTPHSLRQQFGIEGGSGASLTAVGIVFSVAELPRVQSLLQANAIRMTASAGRLIVPPAPGQGATFIFEEAR